FSRDWSSDVCSSDLGHGLGFIERLECLALFANDFEANLILLRRTEIGVNLPVLLRHEGTNLLLALHHQLHRYRLHATGGQAAGEDRKSVVQGRKAAQ